LTEKLSAQQKEYNKKHKIQARNVVRSLKEKKVDKKLENVDDFKKIPKDELKLLIKDLEKDMKDAASNLDFETAAKIRDQLILLKGVSAK